VENPDQLYIAALNKMDSKLYTTTSRAAAVVGIAANLFQAENLAETEILRIEGNLMHRSDIGTASLINSSIQQMRELREVDEEDKKLRIAILGSTKGTDMLALIGAAKAGRLNASIELVISDREEAIILERARAHDLKHVFINPKGQSHADFEQKLSDALDEQRIQLVVLIGYMKILSKSFVEQWQNQIINIHPSLLPAFGGSMDRNVHQLVLDAKVPETGCTVHYVTEQVDAGPIILQKTCSVLSDDTVESLKERVQALEGQALVEAINLIALSELSLTTELQYEPSRA
jgi:phosphoribosylglycinamide formyltransferase-1